jgi:hypothetical protein
MWAPYKLASASSETAPLFRLIAPGKLVSNKSGSEPPSPFIVQQLYKFTRRQVTIFIYIFFA